MSFIRGQLDLTGTKIGRVLIERPSQFRPLRWSVKCERCGSAWNEPHSAKLVAGQMDYFCANGLCNREQEYLSRLPKVKINPVEYW